VLFSSAIEQLSLGFHAGKCLFIETLENNRREHLSSSTPEILSYDLNQNYNCSLQKRSFLLGYNIAVKGLKQLVEMSSNPSITTYTLPEDSVISLIYSRAYNEAKKNVYESSNLQSPPFDLSRIYHLTIEKQIYSFVYNFFTLQFNEANREPLYQAWIKDYADFSHQSADPFSITNILD
jgi:hypothetical protein